jgi:fructose-bisphosphate aldolase class II
MWIVLNYTQPRRYSYEELSKISPKFTIAAAWKCAWSLQTRKCKINSKNLKKTLRITFKINLIQDTIQLILFFMVDQDLLEEIREGISYGVIKMNID